MYVKWELKNVMINTLLLSELIYRLRVPPRPSEATLYRSDQISFAFFGDSKPNKSAISIIKDEKICQNTHRKNTIKWLWIDKIRKFL